MNVEPQPSESGKRLAPTDFVLEQVRQALVGLKFGQITLVLQDGVIVQLERTERKRFRRAER